MHMLFNIVRIKLFIAIFVINFDQGFLKIVAEIIVVKSNGGNNMASNILGLYVNITTLSMEKHNGELAIVIGAKLPVGQLFDICVI